MKKILLSVVCLIVSITIFSQGFVAQGSTTLIGVNSSYSVQPLNVGLGTNFPSALLHTNGTVRLENLPNILNNRILATDLNGNVSWRDVSTISGSDPNAWSILGNTNINDATNYLGTTNNQAINFRVNNIRRFSVGRQFTASGFTRNVSPVEVGLQADQTNLSNFFIYSRDVTGLSIPAFITADVAGMTYSNLSGNNNTLGRLIRYNQGNTVDGGGNNFFDVGISNTQALYFTGHQTPGSLTAMPVKMFTISSIANQNRVGIKMAWNSEPTADFHTVGTVRHENLPTGSGAILVIDATGNIFRSSATASRVSTNDKEVSKEIGLLKAKVAELETILKNLQNEISGVSKPRTFNNIEIRDGFNNDQEIILYQNFPNPYKGNTNIRYSFLNSTKFTHKAFLNIYNLEGKKVKSLPVLVSSNGALSSVNINLPSGTYTAQISTENGLTSNPIKMIKIN